MNKLNSSFLLSKIIGLFLGPVFFILIKYSNIDILSDSALNVVSLASWMLIWWITEAVSISVTALLPLLIFPLFNVMPMNDVGANYGSSIVFLFFGGFVIALSMEKVNLHKRISLSIINKIGSTPKRIILGFMISTAFLSMWISNTASTVVMLPIALSVIDLLIKKEKYNNQEYNFSLCIMLGIAFSANAGGIATIIGTPPNIVLIGLLENEYNIKISFLNWMVIGLPFSIVLIGIIYLVLTKLIFPINNLSFKASNDLIYKQLKALGRISNKEKLVLIIFTTTVFLWIFRGLINSLFPDLLISDTSISIAAAILLFTIPYDLKKFKFILKWNDTKNLSWGILLLFGGGLALAKGMSQTGIILIITNLITETYLSTFLIVSLLIALMLFMTELMSNVALVAVIAPVVAGMAIGLNIPLLHLLIPITIASSCAFMLPMATPPNAIVFASGYVRVFEMARVGIILNVISIIMLVIVYKYFIPLVF